MRFISSDPKGKYLAELKAQMDSVFDIRQERFTGFFLGGFFSVTHHSEYHWNHRITSQLNSAVGYVKKGKDGCSVHFLKSKGYLHPIRFLILLACVLMIPITQNAPWTVYALSILITLGVVSIVAFIESLTEESIEGEARLLALLSNPENPYEDFHPDDYLE